MSLEDIKSIASEAGIDPVLIERAARLLPRGSRESPWDRIIGGPMRRRLQARLATPMTAERASHLLSVIRAFAEQHGVGETNASGLVWRTHRAETFVTIHNEGEGSRVLITTDHRVHVVVNGVLGAAGGLVVALLIGGILPFERWPDVVDMTFLGISVSSGVALARRFWKRKTSMVRQRMDELMETIGRAMTGVGTDDVPVDPQE